MKYSLHLLIVLSISISPLFAHEHSHNGSDKQVKYIENKAQWHKNVIYKADIISGCVFLEKNTFTYSFYDAAQLDKIHHQSHEEFPQFRQEDALVNCYAYKTEFLNSNANVKLSASEYSSEYINYFLGDDPDKWASDIHPARVVTYENIYSHIDLKVYSQESDFKYDFIIHPGGNPKDIRISYKGVDPKIRDGNLILPIGFTEMMEMAPYAYQVVNGRIIEVACQFSLSDNILTYSLPNGFDPSYELVIDPVLVSCTFSGTVTSGNYGHSSTFDANENIYTGAISWGTGYPSTTGAFQTFYGGATDIAISKLSPNGSTRLYATYIGGGSSDYPHSLIVNSNNELVIMGTSSSTNYPTTTGAYDGTHNGGADIIVTVLNSSGTGLIGSTFVGGSSNDGRNNINYNYGDTYRGEVILDDLNNIYVGNTTASSNFPTTTNAYQTTFGGNQDAVVFKLNPNATQLLFSTFIGGTNTEIAYSLRTDSNYHVYVCGTTKSSNFPTVIGSANTTYLGGSDDGFLLKLDSTGSNLVHSTFMGSTARDQAFFLDLDANGNIYVFGHTAGVIPVSAGVYSNAGSSQFIQKFGPMLDTILLSTTVGTGVSSSPDIVPTGFMIDECGNIYWGGVASSGNELPLPVTTDAFISNDIAGTSFFYYMVLGTNLGSLLYGSYFGAIGTWSHVDGGTSRYSKTGVVYQAVCNNASNWPTTASAVNPVKLNGSSYDIISFKIDFEKAGVQSKFTVSSDTGCVPFSIPFMNNSVNADSFFWDFGNGQTSTDSMPTHLYDTPGTYQIMLIAIKTYGDCAGSDTHVVNLTVLTDSLTHAAFADSVEQNCDSLVVHLTNMSTYATGYRWDFGDGTTSTDSSATLTHTYSQSGTYTITLIATNPIACNLADTVTKTYTLGPKVEAEFNTPPPNCVPHAAVFYNTSSNATSYFWDFGNGQTSTMITPFNLYDSSGTFTVTLIANNPNTCNQSDTATFTMFIKDSGLSAAINATETGDCDSIEVQLSTTVSPIGNAFWDFGDGTTSVDSQSTHTYYQPGTYTITLILTDTSYCEGTDTGTYTVTLLPKVEAGFVPPPDTCFPGSIYLDANNVNATGHTWDLGDGNTSQNTTLTHSYNAAGIYNIMLIATNPNSCNLADTLFHSYNMAALPVAGFSVTPDPAYVNSDVNCLNLSIGAVSYEWKFGNSTTSLEVNPIFQYQERGSYNIMLIATSAEGCVDTAYKKLDVIELDGRLFIPTAFSPNGDGMNDRFYVVGEDIEYFHLKIFNRWGHLVFETNSPTEGWNGTHNGVPQNIGVFIYHVRATFLDGASRDHKGNVTLIR